MDNNNQWQGSLPGQDGLPLGLVDFTEVSDPPRISRPAYMYRAYSGILNAANPSDTVNFREIPHKWVLNVQSKMPNVLITVGEQLGSKITFAGATIGTDADHYGSIQRIEAPGSQGYPQMTISATGDTGWSVLYTIYALSGYDFNVGL